jgi:hypothetical protein
LTLLLTIRRAFADVQLVVVAADHDRRSHACLLFQRDPAQGMLNDFRHKISRYAVAFEERRWENLHELRAVYATLLRNGFTLESKRPA